MVRVPAIKQLNVKIQARMSNEGFPELLDEIGLKFSDAFPFHLHIVDKVGPSGKIGNHPDKRFVHGEIGVGKSHDTLFIAKRLFNCQPKTDADVLNGMMRINPEVSLAGNIQVKDAMLRKQSEHMVEELDSGLNIALPGSIQIQRDGYICLVRIAIYLCCSSFHLIPERSLCLHRSRVKKGMKRGQETVVFIRRAYADPQAL
jgi:hypothetical protein